MAYRILTAGVGWQVCADNALRQRITRLVHRQFRHDPEIEKHVRGEILGHRYLQFDSWRHAEEVVRSARAKMCRERLVGLAVRLSRDEVVFEGLEETTGQTKLTPEKLRGHSARFLDLSADWLLLAIERHPLKSTGAVLVQYWLYSRKVKTLRLLTSGRDVLTQAVVGGDVHVKHGDGPWQTPDSEAETDFWATVRKHLGANAAEEIQRSIAPQESGLLDPPPDVLEECHRLTGIDVAASEHRAVAARGKVYIEKYGQQPGTPGVHWVTDAGIRLGIVPNKDEIPPAT